jgi:hypothetical protein
VDANRVQTHTTSLHCVTMSPLTVPTLRSAPITTATATANHHGYFITVSTLATIADKLHCSTSRGS